MFQICNCHSSLIIHLLNQSFTLIHIKTFWSTWHLHAFYPITRDWRIIWKHLLFLCENWSWVTFDPHWKRAVHPESNYGPSFFFFPLFQQKPSTSSKTTGHSVVLQCLPWANTLPPGPAQSNAVAPLTGNVHHLLCHAWGPVVNTGRGVLWPSPLSTHPVVYTRDIHKILPGPAEPTETTLMILKVLRSRSRIILRVLGLLLF